MILDGPDDELADDELVDVTDEPDDEDWRHRLRRDGLPIRTDAPTSATSPAVQQLVADSWATPTERVGAGELALRSWAPSTIDGYGEDWNEFCAWCHSVGIAEPLDVDDRVVAEYVAALVRDRLAYATIRRRIAGITFAFDVSQHHFAPTRSDLVRRTLKGAARTLGTAQRRAEPIVLDELRRILVGLPIVRSAHQQRRDTAVAVRRDQFMLALGWAAALRCSELVGLDAEDLAFAGDPDHGTGGMMVRIRKSKGDQDGRSEYVAVPYSTQASTCPVRMGLRATRQTRTGPLFRRIDRHGHVKERLRPNAVSVIVKTAVTEVLGRPADPYSSHSLRAGFVTEARRQGAADHLIARHTRHRTVAMLDVYDRPSELLSQPALAEGWW